MPTGTAANRLRKLLLFDAVRRLSENVCWRCGHTIESAVELSLDHVKFWQGISADLFWDLSNIKWSHLRCNTTNTRNRRFFGKVTDDTIVVCVTCHTPKPATAFSKHPTSISGIMTQCLACKKKADDPRRSHRKKIGASEGNRILFSGLEAQGTTNIPRSLETNWLPKAVQYLQTRLQAVQKI